MRLLYIRYLCLRIKLHNYDYPECDKTKSHATIDWNNQRFTHSLNGLFHVLRRWKPSSNRDIGLILEITAYSPGDNECSQAASLEYELHDNFQLEEDLETSPSFPEFMDAKEARDLLAAGKNWHRPMAIQGLERLQSTPLELRTRRNFEQVPIVHTHWMRHRFSRGIADSSPARILRKTLTSVASLRLEAVSGPYIRFCRTSRICWYLTTMRTSCLLAF
ncbi:hypothetical protein FocTR4_00014859 [Fusarium oxysporum f. sp. cubense]|uniref:Uncharacterized protein n=2 Tax=Fusarium oxysporum species complex TaxID=171631 RepID=A0A5C6SVI2_FUSOC|nr:hypothetical protein FocTR4_00014859 [Fusarium oxysporum f. sp. cubense]